MPAGQIRPEARRRGGCRRGVRHAGYARGFRVAVAHLIRDVLPTLGAIGKLDTTVQRSNRQSAANDQESPLREAIGDFRIVREIGRGDLGIVCVWNLATGELARARGARHRRRLYLGDSFVWKDAHFQRFR